MQIHSEVKAEQSTGSETYQTLAPVANKCLSRCVLAECSDRRIKETEHT